MACESRAIDSFGAYVGHVVFARPFADAEFSTAYSLLHPEIRSGKMSDAAQTFAVNDSDGRSRIAAQGQSGVAQPEVGKDRLQAKQLCRSADDCCELRLA